MKTIVEPKDMVEKIWGKQKVKEDAIYRLMKYVLRVDHEGKVLLHNVVTGQLVVLDDGEAEALGRLPAPYAPVLEQLVARHYLVPEDYDEHQQVVNLRHILWRMVDAQSSKDITYYTILPTTACNARCWYCYEKGITPVTMTEKTANDVVSFIVRSCGSKPIKIRWLGGEPTVAANRIDQISRGLLEHGVTYTSNITTNGYLLDEDMVIRAKEIWHTSVVNISVDGMEETYNRVKAYQGVKDNPYQRMMRNAELLLKHGINVAIRMNYDQETWSEFPKLIEEAGERFRQYHNWMVHPHQINWDVPSDMKEEIEDWYTQKNAELYRMAIRDGHYLDHHNLPSILFIMCEAGDDSCTTILPDGSLICCPEKTDDDQICGDVCHGVTNQERVQNWKRFADYDRCNKCSLFPSCSRLLGCSGEDRCTGKAFSLQSINDLMIKRYINEKRFATN